MALTQQEYRLNPEAVDQIAGGIQKFLTDAGLARRDALRLRLSMEEVLLRLMDAPAPPKSVMLGMGKRFGRLTVSLRYSGESFDPTRDGGADGDWSGRILANLGAAPTWSWRGGVNSVLLRPPRAGGRSSLFYLLLAVLLAAAAGALGGLLPEALRQSIDTLVLTPLFDAFIGLLNTFAGIMIFFGVCTGVFGIGDTASLSRIGKTQLLNFLIGLVITAVISLALARPFVRLGAVTGAGGASQAQQVADMFFQILPSNPILPYLEANILQIIVLSVFAGIVLLILGERADRVRALAEQLNVVFQTMMEYVCKLIPVFVFASLTRQLWNGALAQILGLWKPFCVIVALDALLVLLELLFVSRCVRCRPRLLLGKVFPPFLVALTTASSMASYTLASETSRRKLGIAPRLFDFSFPIAVVTFMPAAVVTFTVMAYCFAESYGVLVSPAWYIMAALLAVVLSIACPPVPGAMVTCYGMLLAQLGIPDEALALAVTLNVVLDFIMTGTDVLMILLELVYGAHQLQMLRHEVLCKSE